MSKVVVTDHPLVQHKVTVMRDKDTNTKDFRALLREVSLLMAYEVTRDLPLRDTEVETPICRATLKTCATDKITIVPILRAGLGMVDGMLELLPNARVGHIGLYRDHETLKPVEYYFKVPDDFADSEIIVVDPMLATAGSAIGAIEMLKKRGAKNLRFMCLIASKFGVKALTEAHPDVDVYIAALDDELNENAYIVPGLGDAGDRIFGTK